MRAVARCTSSRFLGGGEQRQGNPDHRAATIGPRQRLNAAARAQGWEIGFSIGVASFARAPERLGDVVRSADDLMYRVKHSGKNRVVLERFEPPAPDGVAVR